ncbi:hypothetical protein B0H13DRAFT_2356339 [Mycena leptocephala]|nr:hypothetical protein B0H13DRAFT_2356339 [Mycena leptocephala]
MPDTFTWSSKEGYSLVRRILRNTPLPYEPHDDQLEGVCKSLDGINLVAITPTGSKKTGYYTIYMLVMLSVVADPTLCPSASFPSNPCLLVICPTIPLQLEMVCTVGNTDAFGGINIIFAGDFSQFGNTQGFAYIIQQSTSDHRNLVYKQIINSFPHRH